MRVVSVRIRPLKALAFLAFAPGSWLHGAGTDAGANATLAVSIRKALTIVQQQDLDFGGLIVGGASGSATATLNPRTNALTRAGALIVGTFNTHSRAQFRVTGSRNATYDVLLPSALTLTGSDGGTLQLAPMTFWSTTAASGSSGALAGNGRDTLRVGGTLTIPGTPVDGDYSAVFSVTVAYN